MTEASDLYARLALERRNAREGAEGFVAACAARDAAAFYKAIDVLNERTVDGWRLAMQRVARLPAVSVDIQKAFLEVWIESKLLPLRVGDRRVLADALHLLLPCDYRGSPMRLYRGTSWQERCRHRYGFSWTRDRATAVGFAEHWAQHLLPQMRFMGLEDGGGVVLETLAPAEAILLMRDDESYYDEREVVVDPFKLETVSVTERLSPPRA